MRGALAMLLALLAPGCLWPEPVTEQRQTNNDQGPVIVKPNPNQEVIGTHLDGTHCRVTVGLNEVSSAATGGLTARFYLNYLDPTLGGPPIGNGHDVDYPLRLNQGVTGPIPIYTLDPIDLDLTPLVSSLFPENSTKSNLLYVFVSDQFADPSFPVAAPGFAVVSTTWELDLTSSPSCDPHYFAP